MFRLGRVSLKLPTGFSFKPAPHAMKSGSSKDSPDCKQLLGKTRSSQRRPKEVTSTRVTAPKADVTDLTDDDNLSFDDDGIDFEAYIQSDTVARQDGVTEDTSTRVLESPSGDRDSDMANATFTTTDNTTISADSNSMSVTPDTSLRTDYNDFAKEEQEYGNLSSANHVPGGDSTTRPVLEFQLFHNSRPDSHHTSSDHNQQPPAAQSIQRFQQVSTAKKILSPGPYPYPRAIPITSPHPSDNLAIDFERANQVPSATEHAYGEMTLEDWQKSGDSLLARASDLIRRAADVRKRKAEALAALETKIDDHVKMLDRRFKGLLSEKERIRIRAANLVNEAGGECGYST
ncbi:hypothetical protein POJ06DRAFT_235893 [Lipomyces tetrasporus]|uniref:Extracellular mutant protein 11 C-terminal domain-containing protein n=1 Tax=Lipomyces tetrasporus TaxID=54092 RepID=A0AAD7QWV2_9ASCO|nr:uncharacterized protein POJ06DRAFT_235893 [Lipomyces tetrasporus]KAJ8102950.1 hypothetical protein POJ06DRAFT_235893 [Lipomyces tetrasporus]